MIDTKITASDGRVFLVREMGPEHMLDIMEIGGEAANHAAWVRFALTVFSVVEINGVPLPAPQSKAQLRARAKEIGNTGLIAVGEMLKLKNETVAETEEVAKN